jgi:CBS domain-containing protein
VAGSLSLEPLEKIMTSAQNEKRFLAHVLNGALAFHPPLGFLNRLRSKDGKIDIKKSGIAPVVGLARVAALAAGSRERSTLERLRVAATVGSVIDRDSAQALAEMMPFLLRMRLRAQLVAHENHRPLDNSIILTDLSRLERRQLREHFILVKQIQEDLRATWRLDPIS